MDIRNEQTAPLGDEGSCTRIGSARSGFPNSLLLSTSMMMSDPGQIQDITIQKLSRCQAHASRLSAISLPLNRRFVYYPYQPVPRASQ